MWILCRSDIGYVENSNSVIKAPCCDFVVLTKIMEIQDFTKSAQNAAIFAISPKNEQNGVSHSDGQIDKKLAHKKGSQIFCRVILMFSNPSL